MCKIFFLIFQEIFFVQKHYICFKILRIILESFKLHYFFLASNTCDGYFAAQTRIRSDASSCYTVANLNAREFWCAVSGFGQCLIVSGVPALTKFKCLAAKHSCLNPLWTYFSLRVHGWIQTTVSQLAGVRGFRRKRQLSFFTIGCWLFIYRCSEHLNKQFSQSRNRFLRRPPTSQDRRFALRQLLWPDYSTYKSFDSSTKAIPSLHFISLAVRDRQWNELSAKFKITWRHSITDH